MCGIAGFVWKDQQRPADIESIETMCQMLAHRGPDDSAVFLVGPLALGHRRLSILDLSPAGRQPMSSNDGRYTITFNGEIYNYLEIRKELEQKGVHFDTGTDTEVILKAYRQWGQDCVSRFNGMWAFAVYDQREQSLFMSRDRIGIKPLYYLLNSECFVFASEIKAILAVRPGRASAASTVRGALP